MNPATNKSSKCLICNNNDWGKLSHVNRSNLNFTLEMCLKCGFVAQNPPLSANYLKNYYQNNYMVKNYNYSLSKIYQMTGPIKARISFLKKNNYLKRLSNVLEIGPGAGTMMKAISDHGISIAGVEPDNSAAEWIENNLGLTVYKGFFDKAYDQNKNNWVLKKFDGIIMNHVLEHIYNPLDFFKKINKITTKDVIIVIEVPNIKKPFTDEFNWESYCDPGHLYYFSENSLKLLLHKSGFESEILTDEIFKPYENLLCISKKNNVLSYPVKYDDPLEIKVLWNKFIKYHKWRWIKFKMSRLLKKISFK